MAAQHPIEQGAAPFAANALAAVIADARDWTLQVALPKWAGSGRTPCGLFAERIAMDGAPDGSYYRTFVQARHIFSFARGGELGWQGPWDRLVGETMELLLANARRSDGLFVHRLTGEGQVLDGRADLYDQAFMLFALGMAARALGREAYYDEAERFSALLTEHWGLPGGGYWEGEIVDLSVRRQNPHMHLLEACLCLYEGSGREGFLDSARSLAELCATRFIDPASGALLEYFDPAWRPAAGELGAVVEPGHCFEWAWLFERLSAFGWDRGTALAERLVSFARQHGICATRHVAINEVMLDGRARNPDARLWPQTERLKAAVARFRRGGDASEVAEIVAAAHGLDKYLQVDQAGLWRDKLRNDGSWVDELAPGSSLYHIVCAYAELMRL